MPERPAPTPTPGTPTDAGGGQRGPITTRALRAPREGTGAGWGPVITPDPPSRDDVRAWTQLSDRTVTDAMLDGVIAAEVAAQFHVCHFDDDPAAPYPPELVQALYRRVAREFAARMLPLGLTDVAAEFGPARIPAYDAEIARLEAARRRVVVA